MLRFEWRFAGIDLCCGPKYGRLLGVGIALLVRSASGQGGVQKDLDAYVTHAMEVNKVPGLALAIVKDGKVLLAQGYGVKRIGSPDPVAKDTLFGIASNSKAFTATALAILVDQGKLAWDDPVTKYLPGFALSDPYVTKEITVRDILVHRSGLGLGEGDLMFWPPTTFARKEIVQRLRYLPLATSFRSAYAYDNVLYCVAGELIEAITGESWETAIPKLIFQKLGMSDTVSSPTAAIRSGRISGTHTVVDGKPRAIDPFDTDAVDPAGGIHSTAGDMAKWMLAQLAQGQYSGGRLFSAAQSRELWTGVTPTPIGELPPEAKPLQSEFALYALGFGVRDFAGHKMVSHGGEISGFVSLVAMIPDLHVGVAILTNSDSTSATNAIAFRVLDAFVGRPPTDWTAVFAKYTDQGKDRIEALKRKMDAARNKQSHPSLALGGYAGTYTDPWYGKVSVAKEGSGLVIRFGRTPSLVGDLEHWQYDTFVVRWRKRELAADAFITFSLNEDGKVDTAKMKPFTPDVDFSYDFQDLKLHRN